PLSAGPATFSEVHLAVLDCQLHTATTVAARPWIDHATGRCHQPDQHVYPPDHQPDDCQQRQGRPQARLIAKTLVGNQDIGCLLNSATRSSITLLCGLSWLKLLLRTSRASANAWV